MFACDILPSDVIVKTLGPHSLYQLQLFLARGQPLVGCLCAVNIYYPSLIYQYGQLLPVLCARARYFNYCYTDLSNNSDDETGFK